MCKRRQCRCWCPVYQIAHLKYSDFPIVREGIVEYSKCSGNFTRQQHFFSTRVFFHRNWRFTGRYGKVGDHLYSSITLPPTYEHPDVYLLYMWDDYHIFLIALLAITRLLLDDEIYRLIGLPSDWLMMECKFLFAFCDELILGFIVATWHRKPVDLNSCRLLPL